ncbi:MAG: hypothetical protein KTR31_10690 [Myxococcales bacterium]|nr:hypothetical protein [Myxococcales bacterium]
MRTLTMVVFAAACSGGDATDDVPDARTCDDVTTEAVGTIPVDQWPEGVQEAFDNYDGVEGRWEVSNSCGADTAIKITTFSREELELVTDPWPSTLNCGCVTDPSFSADSKYDVVGTYPRFEFFVESFEDPAVDNKGLSLTNDDGIATAFAPGSPMGFRGCLTTTVDPLLGSEYEQYTAIVRRTGGSLSVDLILAREDGSFDQCELSNFVLVE